MSRCIHTAIHHAEVPVRQIIAAEPGITIVVTHMAIDERDHEPQGEPTSYPVVGWALLDNGSVDPMFVTEDHGVSPEVYTITRYQGMHHLCDGDRAYEGPWFKLVWPSKINGA
jgi:hypothetical protein